MNSLILVQVNRGVAQRELNYGHGHIFETFFISRNF